MLNVGNSFGMFPKLAMNRGVHCCLRETESCSDPVHILGECSWIALQQNAVQDTLAALFVHSQSCKMKSTVEHGNEFGFNLFLFIGLF